MMYGCGGTHVPQQSQAKVGANFKQGLENALQSGSASSIPKALPNSGNQGSRPRSGVWHPGAKRP